MFLKTNAASQRFRVCFPGYNYEDWDNIKNIRLKVIGTQFKPRVQTRDKSV